MSRIQGMSIGMGMDSADISRSMSEIKREMRGLNSEAKVTSNNFKFGKRDTDSYKKAIDQLSGTTENQRKNVEELGKRYAQTVEEQGASSRAAQDLAIEYNKQADNLNRLENELGGMEQELAKLNEEQRIAESRWNKTGEAMERNGARFEKVGGGMEKVGGIFTVMSAAIVGGVVGLTGGLFALTNKATESADAIAKGAERMGVSTDYYQEMDYWASQNGISQDNMEKALERLNQRVGLAADGNEKYAGALEKLGVDMQGVEEGTISTEDAMATSIQTLSEMENEQEKSALASELFGTKLSRELMPALNDGSLSIEEAKEKAEELGLVMSEDQIEAAEAFQDAQDDIKRSMGAVATQIGLDLMPHFQSMLDWILDNMPSIRETIMNAFDNVIEKVQGVMEWWDKLSGAMKIIIPVISGLALAFGPVLLVAGKMVSALGGIMTAMAPVMTSIAKAGGLIKWLAPLFGVLTAPVTLTIAAIAALGAGFVIAYNKSETFRNFITGLKDRFLEAWEGVLTFKDNFMTAFEGIFALFQGDDGGIDLLESLGLNENQISMITGAVDRIKETFEIMKENVMNALDGVAEFFIEQFQGIKIWWDTDGQMILSAIGTFFENMMRGIERVAQFGLDFVVGLFETFAPIVSGIWEALWPTILFLVENVWEKIQLVIGIAMDLIQGIISGVAAIIEGDWSRFGEVISETAQSIWDRVIGFFEGMRENSIELFNKLTGGAIDKFIEMRDGVIDWVLNLIERALFEWERLKIRTEYHISLLVHNVKQFFSDLLTDTTQKAKDIKNDVTGFFGGLKDNTVDAAKEMWSGVSGFFTDIWDDATSLFNDLVDGARELPGRIGSAISEMASKAVDGAKSMGNSIAENLETVVNRIVGGLNGILNAIGMDDPIDEISIGRFSTGTNNSHGQGIVGAGGNIARFSTGTVNGRIAEDMLGILNDRGPGNGPGGATQEVIERDGKVLAPQGEDALVELKRNDRIRSGAETQSLMSAGVLPRFNMGSGTDGGDSGDSKGLLGTLKDVVSNVWSYITDPAKAFTALMDTVTPDFSGFSGFPGDLLSGGFEFLTGGIENFIKDIFKENEGALGTGKKYAWMNYPMSTPYSPNSPVPGYPTSFNDGHHYGVDYVTPVGTTVRAPMSGQLSSFRNRGGGLIAKLVTGQLRQFWMHMNSVAEAGTVGPGDIIGRTGNSGEWTYGPGHVHYQAQQGTDILNRGTVNPLSVIEGHRLGGRTLTDGLFNLHGGEYIINPENPSEAMKLLALAGKELAGKSKQTSQLPNPTGGNKNHEEMMMKMQQQIDLLTQLVTSNKAIENKELKIGDNQIGQANDRYSSRQSSRQSVKTGRISYV